MIDLDTLEQLARSAASGDVGDRVKFALHVMDPEGMVALIDEVRRLRAALSTPLLTAAFAPYYNGIAGADGVNRDLAACAFDGSAKEVYVYYGEKRTYRSMAEFCSAHPRAPT
jgi:hypothetical protein